MSEKSGVGRVITKGVEAMVEEGVFRYKTAAKQAEAEQIIDRSRFIAYIGPVFSREEAEAFIANIRGMHKQATHNVPAFIIGEKSELQWCSDDGEPQGTSGAPVLQMLDREGLTNIVVVVTRYFGGIKLGTGGLVRAYTSSAKLALEAAGVHRVCEMDFMTVKMDYTYLGKLQNMEKGGLFSIISTDFMDVVILKLNCRPEVNSQVKEMLAELTGGGCQFIEEERKLV